MVALLFFLLGASSTAASIGGSVGDSCLVVGSPCVSSGNDDGGVVVVHGRRVQQSNILCNSKHVCVDTTNKVEISTGIWMPSINLGTWFV